MRRFALTLVVVPVLFLLTMTACGGNNNPGASSTTVASISVSPAAVSVNKGDVLQLTATALNSTGGQIAADFTYTSSNPALVTVSTTGLLCGGTWDSLTAPIVCTPPNSQTTPAGSADITVKAQSITQTVKAFVHDKVDIVEVNPVPACVSMGDTAKLTASAFSTNPAICGGVSKCKLPDATIGPFLWVTTDSAVVSIDNTFDLNGTATAGAPGRTSIFASNANTHSVTTSFTTCPITSISVTQNSTTDPITYAKAETKTLTAVIKDSAGQTLDGTKKNAAGAVTNSAPIKWVSTQPFASGIAAATSTTATATAANPGPGLLLATCAPTSCNLNLPPVFSNAILATVSGTANSTIYAASTTSTSLIPIDSATNTAGTAITLPRAPNSMLMNSLGTKLLLGADTGGIMLVDTASAAVSSITSFFGKVIGFAPDGVHGLVFDPVHSTVFGVNVTTGTPDFGIRVTGTATSADATPDGSIYFITAGNNLYSFNATEGQRNFTMPGIANEITLLASGSAVYTPIQTGPIDARATCQPATVVDTQAAAAPTNIKALPNGDGAVAVSSPEVIVLHGVNVGGTCPVTLTESRTAADLQGGAFKANQLLVTPDSKLAFVTNDTGKLLSYDISSGTVKPITLAGSATASFTMGATLDSKFVYVGASDGTVHKIDTTTLTDAQQITVGLKKADNTNAVPDLVAVRNKS